MNRRKARKQYAIAVILNKLCVVFAVIFAMSLGFDIDKTDPIIIVLIAALGMFLCMLSNTIAAIITHNLYEYGYIKRNKVIKFAITGLEYLGPKGHIEYYHTDAAYTRRR